MPDQFHAHTPPKDDPKNWQPMTQHAQNVADFAADFARAFGAGLLARRLGFLHDVGKYSDNFQRYLRKSHAAGKRVGRADHKAAGTKLALASDSSPLESLLAACVQGHHGGLPDCGAGLLADAVARVEEEGGEDLSVAISRACADFPALADPLSFAIPADRLSREMLTRFVFSCLVDADALDTERHFDAEKSDKRVRPSLADVRAEWQSKLTHSQSELATEGEVNKVRREVYEACLAAAKRAPGVFTLAVPTGGGKTRSSLAFALEHAGRHPRTRIIYAAPYTSILDQTARVFRGILGDDAVLEHHSAVEPRLDKDGDDGSGEDEKAELRRRLSAENWDAPLIVTTTVQLLESLFTHKTARARKLHNVAGSVIILDEAQTLPPRLLAPLLSGLRTLVEHFGVTLVLCTATQPAFDHAVFRDALPAPTPIVPEDVSARHFAALKRVTYTVETEAWDWRTVGQKMRETGKSCLAVVNTKRDALALLNAFDDKTNVFHLSTLLCGAHRMQVLDAVKSALDDERERGGLPVYLVSTQVIEAGVDVDFPRVLRARGPLDRIIQSAGRCNREGRRPVAESRVIVFLPEGLHMPKGNYRTGADVTDAMIKEFGDQLDFDSPTIATDYFVKLYKAVDLDAEKIQRLRVQFDFPTVSDRMRLIDDDTVPVLVPFLKDEFAALDAELSNRARFNLGMTRALWGRAQPHTVAVYRADLGKLTCCEELIPGQLWIWRGKYDDKTGIGGIVDRDPADLIATSARA